MKSVTHSAAIGATATLSPGGNVPQKTLRIDVEDWVWRRLKAIAADSGTTLAKLIAQEITGLATARPPVAGTRSWSDVRAELKPDEAEVAKAAERLDRWAEGFERDDGLPPGPDAGIAQEGFEPLEPAALGAERAARELTALGQQIGDPGPITGEKPHKFVPRSTAKPTICKTCGKRKDDHA
jgi:hypothetical protein